MKRRGSFFIIIIAIFAILLSGCNKSSVIAPAGRVSEATEAAPAKKFDLLILVNKNNVLPEDYNAELVEVDDKQIAGIVINDLSAMREAAKGDGIVLNIASAYRTKEQQQAIFDNVVDNYIKQGSSKTAANEKARQIAALPGYSEHETGLAIDFSTDESAKTQAKMWKWLSENAYEYGFILRYPEGKEEMTGYSYEPWHYRYVGAGTSKRIFEQGVTLEEYLSSRQNKIYNYINTL